MFVAAGKLGLHLDGLITALRSRSRPIRFSVIAIGRNLSDISRQSSPGQRDPGNGHALKYDHRVRSHKPAAVGFLDTGGT